MPPIQRSPQQMKTLILEGLSVSGFHCNFSDINVTIPLKGYGTLQQPDFQNVIVEFKHVETACRILKSWRTIRDCTNWRIYTYKERNAGNGQKILDVNFQDIVFQKWKEAKAVRYQCAKTFPIHLDRRSLTLKVNGRTFTNFNQSVVDFLTKQNQDFKFHLKQEEVGPKK